MADEPKFCTNHEMSKLEIASIKEKANRLDNLIESGLAEVYEAMAKDTKKTEDVLRDYKDSTDKSIEKVKMDIQSLFADYHKLRETVLDIRSTVERASDKTSTRLDKLTEDIKAFVEAKKENKNYFLLPLMAALLSGLVVGIFVYLLTKFS
jgi:DNA repair exonuclease SbcCD ATPase subunit